MTEYEKEIIRASAEIVKGILSNNSIKVKFKEDEEGKVSVWYAAEGSVKVVNVATFFDSVYWGLKAVDLDKE